MSRQLEFKKVGGWGGKRKGAGRPNKSGQVSHAKRIRVRSSIPMHVTWRLKKGLPSLRRRQALKSFKRAAENAKEFGLRLLHFSILNNHVHMMVEANNNKELSSGMRSFGSSFGKAIRKVAGGRGSVFDGRFHLMPLSSPTQTRNALIYVLQNFSKHQNLLHHYDEFSSSPYFADWRRLLGKKRGPILNDLDEVSMPKFLSEPRSWLASEGWTHARG